MIEFKNINKTYDTGTVAVNNANFKIEKGEFAFLVGSSGSGKSTLIKMILKILFLLYIFIKNFRYEFIGN